MAVKHSARADVWCIENKNKRDNETEFQML